MTANTPTLHPDIPVRNSTRTLGPWFNNDLSRLTVGESIGESSLEGASDRWPVYEAGERVGTLFDDASGMTYAPEDERSAAEPYTVVQRSTTSRSLATGKGEILRTGDRTHNDLALAFVEADARTLLEREGDRPWAVEDANGDEIDFTATGLQIEPQAVYDYLVDVLGVEPDQAERMVG